MATTGEFKRDSGGEARPPVMWKCVSSISNFY
jgi:hypothetical protein